MQAKGRDAFLDMIRTIEDGEADFAAVIVYDHSRWGRFQIPHESERYAWVCANAGIDIHLCIGGVPEGAEHLGAVIWSLNSYGSGEFLRVLSAKVHAGHCNLVRLGFRQGGPAGYGLRRVLLNDKGHIKQELKRGDRKSLQTERVVLRPGPQAEVRRVRWMYEQFASHGLSESGIAAELNAKGILTDFGRPWTSATVHQVLTNEKYIGNNLYNRTSAKLTVPRRANAPEDWVRADGAFPSIVPHDLFLTVRQIIAERNRQYSNEELLERLASLFHRRGMLSGLIIDETEDMPPASAYQSRFGSLIRAYEKVGFHPVRDYRYIEINRALRLLHRETVQSTVAQIEAQGSRVRRNPVNDLLAINDEFTASLVVARCQQTAAGGRRWIIRFDASLDPDITVAVRMNGANDAALDYYLLPRSEITGHRLGLAEENGFMFDTYRFDTLEDFVVMTRRSQIAELVSW